MCRAEIWPIWRCAALVLLAVLAASEAPGGAVGSGNLVLLSVNVSRSRSNQERLLSAGSAGEYRGPANYYHFGSGACRGTSASHNPTSWFTIPRSFSGTLEDCQNLCDVRTDCEAIEYIPGTKNHCELWTQEPRATSGNTKWMCMKKQVACALTRGHAIGGDFIQRLNGQTVSSCATACKNTASCKSFNWHGGISACDLSSKCAHDVGGLEKVHSGEPSDHYSCGCEGDVRLMGGSYLWGRVEIYHEGSWGSVCDDKWGAADAQVVCRQLGLAGGSTIFRMDNRRRRGHAWRIWTKDVACSGDESSLASCANHGWGSTNCRHEEDAGVECEMHCATSDDCPSGYECPLGGGMCQGSYRLTAYGASQCDAGMLLQTAQDCKTAARSLGLTYRASVYHRPPHPTGCHSFADRNGMVGVWFNARLGNPGSVDYALVCKVSCATYAAAATCPKTWCVWDGSSCLAPTTSTTTMFQCPIGYTTWTEEIVGSDLKRTPGVDDGNACEAMCSNDHRCLIFEYVAINGYCNLYEAGACERFYFDPTPDLISAVACLKTFASTTTTTSVNAALPLVGMSCCGRYTYESTSLDCPAHYHLQCIDKCTGYCDKFSTCSDLGNTFAEKTSEWKDYEGCTTQLGCCQCIQYEPLAVSEAPIEQSQECDDQGNCIAVLVCPANHDLADEKGMESSATISFDDHSWGVHGIMNCSGYGPNYGTLAVQPTWQSLEGRVACRTCHRSSSPAPPATTTKEPEGLWLPVTEPWDQACRGATHTDNSPGYYEVLPSESLADCKAACLARPHNRCKGIEFSTARCEIWLRPEGIGATSGIPGFTCLRNKLAPVFERAQGCQSCACRGATSSDNLASYFTAQSGIATLQDCQQLCMSEPDCTGIEFSSGRCEVWTRPDGIQAVKQLEGFTCMSYSVRT